MELLLALDWVTIIQAVLTIALAVAAVTPTKADDTAIGRVANLFATLAPFLRRKP
jgi:hypothetical protein